METKKIIFSDNVTHEYLNLQELENEFSKRNISIGDDVYIRDNCKIGNNVRIGNKSIILTNEIAEKSKIGSNVKILITYGRDYPLIVGNNSIIEEDVEISGACIIGNNTVIEGESYLIDSLVGNDVTIRKKFSKLENCIIGNNSKIFGTIGNGSIIGNNVTIGEHVQLKENSKIEDNILMNSIIFWGSNGPVKYWGADEIHLDLGTNHFKENYHIYTIDEFKELFFQNKKIFKLVHSDFDLNGAAICFDEEEMDEYRKICDIILSMHEKGVLKPIKKNHFENKKSRYNSIIRPDDYCNHGPSQGSKYQKYGGLNGYDDETIDDAFEGDPENTWNID